MAGKFHHETLYRGGEIVGKLAAMKLTICGVGAIGSNLADHLARQGTANLRVIDHDRVEEHNVSTQLYGESEVGLWKVEALRNRLYRATGIEIEAVRKELTGANAHGLLKDADMIVDALDNSNGRRIVAETAVAMGIPCVHVGLHEDYFEVIWNETYLVPGNAGADVCDYPLARSLIMLAVAVASEAIVGFAGGAGSKSWSGTLKDLQILPQVDA